MRHPSMLKPPNSALCNVIRGRFSVPLTESMVSPECVPLQVGLERVQRVGVAVESPTVVSLEAICAVSCVAGPRAITADQRTLFWATDDMLNRGDRNDSSGVTAVLLR